MDDKWPVEILNLSKRPRNCLRRAQIPTIGQLVKLTPDDLLALTNFGQKSLDEVRSKLVGLGMQLRDDDLPSRDRPWDRPNRVTQQVLDRRQRALAAYVDDDLTLDQIAQRFQVTREMIRLDVNHEDRVKYLLARRRRQARTRLARFVRDGQPTERICSVCGELFDAARHNQRYCSPIHYSVAMLLRYQTEEGHKAKQRASTAKWILNNPEKSTVYSLRYAQRVVDGEELEERGMWMIRGSLAWHWALRAYALKWPIFDRLPPDVQQQIREEHG